jgi:hypothetical protein
MKLVFVSAITITFNLVHISRMYYPALSACRWRDANEFVSARSVRIDSEILVVADWVGLVGFDFLASVLQGRCCSALSFLSCLGLVYGPLMTPRLTYWAFQESFAVTVGTTL